ncbi:MAG: DUF2058 domain-containing protein [Desulfoprunum sp.]|nr:DUF2058 domain-containing protein [Desulfoprunum sp.]
MGNSFKEQLLKLGLVDKKQVNQVKKAEHQKKKEKVGKSQEIVDENKLLAQQAVAEKKERERLRNQQRQEELRKKEEAEQVRQIIESNRLAKDPKGVAFRFPDKGKIQRIFVAKDMLEDLSRGHLAIVRSSLSYEIVPAAVTERIGALDPRVIVLHNSTKKAGDQDLEDPYAGFEVPDDLMW